MARKRRNRASTAANPASDSATNSIATSSPSSNRNSRSDDNESDLAAAAAAAATAPGAPASHSTANALTRSKRLPSDAHPSPDINVTHLSEYNHHSHPHALPHLSATMHAHSLRQSQTAAGGGGGAGAAAAAVAAAAAGGGGSGGGTNTPSGTSASPSSAQTLAALSASAAPSPAPAQEARTVIEAATAAVAQTVTAGDPTRFSVASVALRLYEQLIDWAVLQFAVQFKQNAYLTSEERRRAGAFPSTGQRASSRISIVHGSCGSSLLFTDKNVTVDCSHCGTSTAASRYALHAEKCLGLGGRMSSRTASQRLRSAAERADKDSAADADDAPPRRRRHSSSASAADHDGMVSSHISHKRRKMSPLTAGGSVSVGHGSLGSRGLPPSGRTRASPK